MYSVFYNGNNLYDEKGRLDTIFFTFKRERIIKFKKYKLAINIFSNIYKLSSQQIL